MTGTQRSNPLRRAALAAGAVALVAALVGATPGTISEASDAVSCRDRVTPEGRVLAFSNNAYETALEDALDSEDMDRMVGRTLQMTFPYVPDIILLQEIRATAVERVVTMLNEQTPCDFAVVANAGRGAWSWETPSRLIGRDTAIVVNSDSMTWGVSGYLTHEYGPEQAAPGQPVKVKMTAWAEILERDDPSSADEPLHLLTASVHFPRTQNFVDEDVSSALKTDFARDIVDHFDSVLPDGSPEDDTIHLIGGDFNNFRYEGRWRNQTSLYRLMTEEYGYTDGFIEHSKGKPNPIDYLFSTGESLGAAADVSTHEETDPFFYSNHDLRWSVISPYES
ncbi:MAG: hypothetical protein M3198_09390 [Actinomycetota bacterium]|nr:hypothetical protein [Actinomycetota bacterium]